MVSGTKSPHQHIISHTRAVGVNHEGFRPFNDLFEHGLFPAEQNVERITKIRLWSGERVTAIRPSYLLKNGGPAGNLHGKDEGNAEEFDLSADQYLVGMYGHRDASGNIGSLTFVVFEGKEGGVTLRGPFGKPPRIGTAFGAFGHIVALAGTDESEFGLCSLSVVNDKSGRPSLL